MKKAALLVIFFTGLFLPRGVLAASLSLSPATVVKSVGDTFTVDIVLDPSPDSVSAVSAIANYDATKVTALSIKQGPLFTGETLTNTIDTTAGQIRYDTGNLGTPVTTRGVVATITFRAIAAGSAQASYVFDANATTGTSLVAAASSPTNLLTRVDGAAFTISSSANPAQPLPPTGVVENTIAIFVGGLIFIGSGILLARRALYAQ